MWALPLVKRIGGALFGNPMLLVVLALAAWGGWQWYQRGEAEEGKLKAENALAEQKLKIVTDANEAWKELNDKQQAFMIVARQAIDRMEKLRDEADARNAGFKKQVGTNAGSKTPLSAADLSDLQLLKSLGAGNDQAGGRALPPGRSTSRVPSPRRVHRSRNDPHPGRTQARLRRRVHGAHQALPLRRGSRCAHRQTQ